MNNRLSPYTPAAIYGPIESIRLLSAFQVAGGLPGDKASALAIIERLTSIDLRAGYDAPDNRGELDLAGWLDWLAVHAQRTGAMEWFEPFAWAVPAAAARHWF